MPPHPIRSSPTMIAQMMDRSASRRRARALGSGVAGVVGLVARIMGTGGLSHRLARRLGRIVVTTPPVIATFEPEDMFAAFTGLRVLLVSHDLSQSGAPRIVVEIARQLRARGDCVTVLAAEDGPRRDELLADGVPVIVDPATLSPSAPLPRALGAAFDVALCNTIATYHCAAALASSIPTILYTHETTLIEELLTTSSAMPQALADVAEVWAGSELSAALVRSIRSDVVVMPYGLNRITDTVGGRPPIGTCDPVIMTVLGSFEPRKGQDLLVEAVARLDPAIRARLRVRMYGRVLEPGFHAALEERIETISEVSLHGPLNATDYQAVVLGADAVVVPSRSDTLPLVSLDALGAGRLLLCTKSTGTSDYIRSGTSGFVAEIAEPKALAAMLTVAMNRRSDWASIAQAGYGVFARAFSAEAFATATIARVDGLAARA